MACASLRAYIVHVCRWRTLTCTLYAVNHGTAPRRSRRGVERVATERRSRKDRIPLWRDRVLRTAVAYADQAGLDGLTMRRLAQELDVAPMALYRHVANKDDLVDAMIDLVFAEIELPADDIGWKAWMRTR